MQISVFYQLENLEIGRLKQSFDGDGVTMRYSLILVAIFALTGCAGRQPNPVAVTQPRDHLADCGQIRAEITANNTQLQQLADDEGLKLAQNMAAGTLGFFTLGLGWFALDTKGTAKTEGQALSTRNEYLANIASQRCQQGNARPYIPPPS